MIARIKVREGMIRRRKFMWENESYPDRPYFELRDSSGGFLAHVMLMDNGRIEYEVFPRNDANVGPRDNVFGWAITPELAMKAVEVIIAGMDYLEL